MRFLDELKRRNVIKATIAYITVAWVLLQVLSIVLPNFGAPEWVLKTVTFILISGLPIWVIFSWVYELSPEGIKKTSDVDLDKSTTAETNKRLNIIIVITLIIIAAITYFKDPDTSQTNVRKGKSDFNHEYSIAVLPFNNDSPDEKNVYFCDGITEGVRENLSKIPGFRVVSRTSVEKFRNSHSSISEIANELGVEYILEGSVLRIDDRSVINARLISASDDMNIWSDKYDKELEDIFSVLAEVTSEIAEKLETKISPDVMRNIEHQPTQDTKALDYYMQGKEYLNHYQLSGREQDLENADRLFNLALDQDSLFASAYIGSARIFREKYRLMFHDNEHLVDSLFYLIQKSIELDPYLADAYFVRAAYFDDIKFDIPRANKDLEKALELNPNHVDAIRQLAWLSWVHNREVVFAVRMLNKLQKLDRSTRGLYSTYISLSQLYWDLGDHEKGYFYINKAAEINEISGLKAWYYVQEGRVTEAIDLFVEMEGLDRTTRMGALGFFHLVLKEYEKAEEYYKEWSDRILKQEEPSETGLRDWHRYGQVLYGLGKKEEGIRLMEYQLKKNESLMLNYIGSYGVLYETAGIHSFLGNEEKAFEYLRIFDETNRWDDGKIYWIQSDPSFDNIRGKEEFKKIINKRLQERSNDRQKLAELEAKGEI